MNRRRFLRYGGTLGAAGLALGQAPVATAEPVDDLGNPIEGFRSMTAGFASRGSVPETKANGEVVSGRYDWRTPGAPRTGNGYALELEDRGGIDVGFRPRTTGNLTIDFHWRHRSGSRLAYTFNDQDSTGSGFRAFTNGIARKGIWFRNTFGGNDVVYRGDLQDGRWHRIRVVLDAAANTFTAYVDGQRVGRSYYHGRGWAAADRFRIMGRYSGTRTRIEYDRYVIANEALHPNDSSAVRGTLIHYELEEGEGRTLTNGSALGDLDSLVERKGALIESIRSDVGRVLPERDAERLDRRAERLLERIDGGIDQADERTSQQYERALNRMIAAEEVTRTATESGIEPANRIAVATVDLGLIGAVGRIAGRSLRLMGWGARRIASILSTIASIARRVLDALTGRVLLSLSRRRELDRALAGIERRVSALLDQFGSEIEAVGEALLSDSIGSSIEYLPEEVINTLKQIRDEFTGVIERIFYRSFQLDAKPTIGSLDIGVPGVNVSIGNAMETVSDGIDSESLHGGWRDERTAASERVCESLQESKTVFLGGMNVLADGAEDVGHLSMTVVIAGLGFFAVGVCIGATGVGLAAGTALALAAAKLQVAAAALGKISIALTVSISFVGIAFLTWMAKRHEETVVELVASDPVSQVMS